MVTLPTGFQFSQGSLQDYVDCPRRFQLRYVERLAWPADEAEPALEHERYLRQGTAFHRLIHQHMLGISPEQLSSMVADEDLRRWWRNYMESRLIDLPAPGYPEILLSAPVSGYRLVAKYDLVAVDAGRRAIIVDWKTSRKRSQWKWLAERLQTRVYPYLLVQAGSHLNAGQSLQPEQVEMVYWFANFPLAPERFTYDAAQYKADEAYLISLIEEIDGLGDRDFPLTTQERRCRYCRYRSLCQRGIRAGLLDEVEEGAKLDDELGFTFDFEQVAEIEY
jgi:CRISPR/Cas system-associated exonuclease Cas4 (RecB family)